MARPTASAVPPDDEIPRSRRNPAIAGGLLLGVAAAGYFLAFPPTLNPSDESLFLYGAKRVRDGQVLYRDFFEFITPASFYLFALVYAVAGTTLQAARAAMAGVNALSVVLIFVLARKMAGVTEAVIAAAAFAVACVPVWNVASPHWISTCLCLATAAVLLSERWAASPRLRPAVAGALAGLSFATQQQRGVFLGVWLVVALLLLPGGDARRAATRWLRALVWAGAGWTAVVTAILGYAIWQSSIRLLVQAIFTFVFYAYRPRHLGSTGWGATMWLTNYAAGYSWSWLPTAVPVVLVVEAVVLSLRLARHRGRREAVRAALFLLACCMAGAIFYFPDMIHVAFIFPFTLVVAAGLVSRLRSSPRLRRVEWVTEVALGLVLLVVLHKGLRNVLLTRLQYPVRFQTAFGTVATTDTARDIVVHLRRSLSDVPAERRKVFSYPADASLYLTLPGENPTPFSLLLPDYNTPAQYEQAFAALADGGADFVIVAPLFVRAGADPLMKFLEGQYVRRERLGLIGPDVYVPAHPRPGRPTQAP